MQTNNVFTVAGAKGGVGKTTTALNLGASLAEAGYATITVELDLAMANLLDFIDLGFDASETPTLHDVLAGTEETVTAVYENSDGLALLPSGTDIDAYAETDLGRLPDVIETLRWHYDFVIIDTPAGLSEETIQPLRLADEVLLVSTPRVASIRNVQNTMALADRVDTDIRGLVLTKSGTGASPGADRIAEFLDVELLGHVPEDDAVPHSQDKGQPVVSNAPRSGAAIAYEKIASKIVDPAPSDTGPEASDRGIDPSTQGDPAVLEGATDGGETVSARDDDAPDVSAGDREEEAEADVTSRDTSAAEDHDESDAVTETESETTTEDEQIGASPADEAGEGRSEDPSDEDTDDRSASVDQTTSAPESGAEGTDVGSDNDSSTGDDSDQRDDTPTFDPAGSATGDSEPAGPSMPDENTDSSAQNEREGSSVTARILSAIGL